MNNIKPGRGMEDYYHEILSAKQTERAHGSIMSTAEIQAERHSSALKRSRLASFGLPTFGHFGIHPSRQEALASVPPEIRNTTAFLVRCEPFDQHQSLKLERVLDVSWEQAVDFIDNLPAGHDKYKIEIRDFWNSDLCGTIISNGHGFTIVEIAEGNHADMDQKDIRSITSGQFDAENIAPWFNWSEGSPTEHREVALTAIRYFIPRINRLNLSHLTIYAEFVYHRTYGFRFVEATTTPFWTKRP